MPLPTEAQAVQALAKHLEEDPADESVSADARAALDMVTRHLGAAGSAAIPATVGALAVTECGAAVFYRRLARNGITTFGSGEVVPMRISKDPMSTVYPMLDPYATPGISR